MTESEKRVIRTKPCARCASVPPFSDGSRCHVHRIVRGKDGGQYVAGNVIALCPPCHREVDRVACITSLVEGRREGCRKGGREGIKVLLALSREQRSANARRAGLASAARLSPEERRARSRVALQSSDPVAAGRKGGSAVVERRRRDGLTPAELAHIRQIGRRDWGKGTQAMNAGLTPERRSEIARMARRALGRHALAAGARNQPVSAKRQGACVANHRRWHVARDMVNANCEMCASTGGL